MPAPARRVILDLFFMKGLPGRLLSSSPESFSRRMLASSKTNPISINSRKSLYFSPTPWVVQGQLVCLQNQVFADCTNNDAWEGQGGGPGRVIRGDSWPPAWAVTRDFFGARAGDFGPNWRQTIAMTF